MLLLFQIAWRNLWRQPARSGILVASIVIGVWAGITVSGMITGMLLQRFDRLITNEITHIQVHHPEYRAERESGMVISRPEEVRSWLSDRSEVAAFSMRTRVDAMIQSPVASAGIMVLGVDPLEESRATELSDLLIDGVYFGDQTRNPVIIGARLADKLKVGTGNRIVLTFQDLNGDIGNAAFTIVGIISTSSVILDERTAIVLRDDIQNLLGGGGPVHEIVMILHDADRAADVAAELNYLFPENLTQTWFEISPELRFASDMSEFLTLIVMAIIMLALAFGILNTMLMSIHERFRELGMLLAIGMNRFRVFTMITMESVLVTVTGAIIGMMIGAASIGLMRRNGVDLGPFGDGMKEFGYDAVIYPSVSVSAFVGVTLLVVVTALVAALYPSWKALRIPPAQAIRD